MAQAYGMTTWDMVDLKKTIIWHWLEENKQIFNSTVSGSAYEMYSEVVNIMTNNWEKIAPHSSLEKMSSSIINHVQ